jgi:hypothetical protein
MTNFFNDFYSKISFQFRIRTRIRIHNIELQIRIRIHNTGAKKEKIVAAN